MTLSEMSPEGAREATPALPFPVEELLSGIDDHLAVLDTGWRYVFVNAKAAGMLGRSREELLGRCIWEVFPEAVGNQFYRELHQAVGERRSIHSEHLYAPWGRWFENHIYPFASGVCVLSTEITGLKLAAQEREHTRVQLEEVARQMPAAVLIADAATGRLVFANEQVKQICGDFPLSADLEDFDRLQPVPGFLPDGRPMGVNDWPMARVLRGEPVRQQEIEIQRPDGARVFIEANADAIRDAEGRVAAAVVVFQDITERKLASDALLEAGRRKDEFLAMLAHELRNPLAPIRTAAHLLRALGVPDPRQQRGLEAIERQVAHLTRLVDDLLDVSRITRGQVELRKEVIEAAAVAARAVETVRPSIAARQQDLTVTLPGQPILLEADLIRLAQALGNLLHNASKYSPSGGRIHLSVERDGGAAVLLRVRDEGIGIPEEQLRQVFELFFQADQSLARSEGGLGIGLTLVRSLVEAHGGQIEARSDGLEKGSEFLIRLPALPPEPAE